MDPDAPRIAIVSTTVGSDADARMLAEWLVGDRLAACVQLVPIQSVYRWKGAIERAPEVLLLAKTRADAADRLVDAIRARHPYELPEILVAPVAHGLQAYMDWVVAETDESAV